MSEDRYTGVLLIIASVIILVIGQSLMKTALSTNGIIPLRFGPAVMYFFQLLGSWKFLTAIAAIVGSALAWYAGLSRTPLSIAYPIAALSYPLILLSAVVFLKEGVSTPVLVGNLLIVTGVIIVGYSRLG